MEHFKRKLLATLAMLPLLSSCMFSAVGGGAGAGDTKPLTPAQKKLQGMGLTLVVDAVEGAEMLGVEFYADGSDFVFFAKSAFSTNRDTMSFPSSTVPETMRIVWRDSSQIVGRPDNPKVNTYAGNILGDYTIPVASRIPDDVVKEIRKNGGGLRLKFRLKPDGVMLGWDIERFSGGLPRSAMSGGDFKEARPAYVVYEDGKPKALPYSMATPLSASDEAFLKKHDLRLVGVQGGILTNPPTPANHRRIWEKGWYINKDGEKVFTDY